MDVSPSAHAAALWAGLHLALLLVLSVLVVRQRRKHRVSLGDGAVPELNLAIRAFGNASEYVPAAMAAIAVLAVVGAAAPVAHLVGVVLFAGRVAHAIGVSRSAAPTLPRAAGILLTWIGYIIAVVTLLFYAVP